MAQTARERHYLDKNTTLLSRLKSEVGTRKGLSLELIQCKRHYQILLKTSENAKKKSQIFSQYLLLKNEEDRREISRELHDEISQVLTGINFQLAILSKEASNSSAELREKIIRTQTLVERSVETIHKFAKDLRPMILDDLGLEPALKASIKEFSARTKIIVKLHTLSTMPRLSDVKTTILFRVAQEALMNISKHSTATQAVIRFSKRENQIRMEIKDNGRAFDVKRALHARGIKRLGLLGMEERVRIIKGSFAITSIRGRGTTLCIQVPIDDAPELKRKQQ